MKKGRICGLFSWLRNIKEGLGMVDPNDGVKSRHGDPFKNQAGCCFSKWVWHIKQRKVSGAA
jgi:hypothetical protein